MLKMIPIHLEKLAVIPACSGPPQFQFLMWEILLDLVMPPSI